MTPPSVFFHDVVPLLKIKISEGKKKYLVLAQRKLLMCSSFPLINVISYYLLLCNIYSKKEMGKNKLK